MYYRIFGRTNGNTPEIYVGNFERVEGECPYLTAMAAVFAGGEGPAVAQLDEWSGGLSAIWEDDAKMWAKEPLPSHPDGERYSSVRYEVGDVTFEVFVDDLPYSEREEFASMSLRAWDVLREASKSGSKLSEADALAILEESNDEILAAMVAAANKIINDRIHEVALRRQDRTTTPLTQWQRVRPCLINGRMHYPVYTIYPQLGMAVRVETDPDKLRKKCLKNGYDYAGQTGVIAHVFGTHIVVQFPDGVKMSYDQDVLFPEGVA